MDLMNDETNQLNLTDLVDDVVFTIAKNLKYDEIVNMCLINSQFVNLFESKYFWITYLKDVYDITGVNDLDLSTLKEGVQLAEYIAERYTSYNSYISYNQIDKNLYAFVKIFKMPDFDINLENFINLHHLNLGDNQIDDISSLTKLETLYLKFNNQINDINSLTKLVTLYSGNNNQITDISNLVNLEQLYLEQNTKELNINGLVKLRV